MSKKVLIVEDNELILLLNERYVTKCGCEVVGRTCDIEEFKLIVKEQQPDVILMDILLGQERDGIDFVLSVPESSAKVIYLSGSSDPATLSRAKLTDYHAFLVKPVIIDELKAALSF